ncbi:hypothetical protein [Pseudomonas coronafaciens]|uniref:hypothetical protein n=1 Tax=Pseudomonas coronafaciens TaxID=53409 RepID=UPI0011C4682C|nr:hypothetical protein [Pseudomonas coronafaciens]
MSNECKAVPVNCRQRLAAEGKPYPRSSCAACGQLSPNWRKCESMLARPACQPSALAQPATAKVDERAEFEAWHNIQYPLHSMLLGFCERTGGYSYPSRREMFEVWQARAKLNACQS